MSKLLTKEGYLLVKDNFDKKLLNKIKKELTVEPYKPFEKNKEKSSYCVYTENDKYLSIPKFYGLKEFGEPDENTEFDGIKVNYNFKGQPNDKQKIILKQTIEHIDKYTGGLLCAGCGAGKTFMAIYIAHHYKVKTLIIVHQTFLMNQWKERIEYFTDAKVGIIQQNKVIVDNCDFVIAMVQSIAKDKYDFTIFTEFGFIIFDEAHHAPSEYFSKALPIISCKKSLSLSATPKRSDKMEKILYWFLGDIAYLAPPNKNDKVVVNIYNYNSSHKKFKVSRNRFTQDVNFPKTLNNIVQLNDRNIFIINILKDILKEEGRQILILSDRIEHLNVLKELIDKDEDINFTCRYYIGGMKQKDLDESAKATIILGTYHMASEGLDIASLNTLIMSTPRKEVEQSIGRIQRKQSDIYPLIIDIVDMLPSLNNKGLYRRKLYKKLDYNINVFEVDNNNIINEFKNVEVKNTSIRLNDIDDIDFID
jgi:superfamily II DNA or RNA helicase